MKINGRYIVTDKPYTDEDLRAEATRQLATAMEDPDFMGIGEQMQDSEIESLSPPEEADGAEGMHWGDLTRDEFEDAQRSIDDLLTSAADVSDWAVNLGADGLEPSEQFVEVKHKDLIGIRVHFAFHPSLPTSAREAFINGLRDGISKGVHDA